MPHQTPCESDCAKPTSPPRPSCPNHCNADPQPPPPASPPDTSASSTTTAAASASTINSKIFTAHPQSPPPPAPPGLISANSTRRPNCPAIAKSCVTKINPAFTSAHNVTESASPTSGVCTRRIQSPRRLDPSQHQPRPIRQRPRHRHPLLLPHRHLPRLVRNPMTQPHPLQQMFPPTSRSAPRPRKRHPHQHILHRRQPRQQMMRLKNVPNLLPPKMYPAPPPTSSPNPKIFPPPIAYSITPESARKNPRQQMQQRRLPRTRSTPATPPGPRSPAKTPPDIHHPLPRSPHQSPPTATSAPSGTSNFFTRSTTRSMSHPLQNKTLSHLTLPPPTKCNTLAIAILLLRISQP